MYEEDYFEFEEKDEYPEELNFEKLIECNYCKKPIPSDALFCLYCGRPVKPKQKKISFIGIILTILIIILIVALLIF